MRDELRMLALAALVLFVMWTVGTAILEIFNVFKQGLGL